MTYLHVKLIETCRCLVANQLSTETEKRIVCPAHITYIETGWSP